MTRTLWALNVVVVFLLFLINQYWFPIIPFLLENDATRISFGIFAVYVASSLSLIIKRPGAKLPLEKHAVETCMALGLLGTTLGIFFVFRVAFGEINTASIEEVKRAIGGLSSGVGTALITTIVGLICSQVIRLQVVLHERH